jgi:hypothetical protein
MIRRENLPLTFVANRKKLSGKAGFPQFQS